MIFLKEKNLTDVVTSKDGSKDSFLELRKYLYDKYKIDYISFFIFNSKYYYYEGNSDIPVDFVNKLNADNFEIRVSKNGLQDSKERKIKARFIVPLKLSKDKFLIIMESEKYKVFDGKEKSILKDVSEFKNLIEGDNYE